MTRLVSAFPSSHGMSLVQAVAKRQLRMHLRKIREREYSKLRSLVPAVASKKKVSKVQVIEEAVRYIEELHSALVDRFREKHGCLATDKAKETVQIFVNRMMEEQPHRQQEQENINLSTNTAATTTTTPTPTTTTAIPTINNINRNSTTAAANQHQQQRRPRPSPFYQRHHHHHQRPYNHHHHINNHHHHHNNINNNNNNNNQVLHHPAQRPVPPHLLYSSTSMLQENIEPTTCTMRSPSSSSSQLQLVRKGRHVV